MVIPGTIPGAHRRDNDIAPEGNQSGSIEDSAVASDVVAGVVGSGSAIFAMDYSAGAAPNAGWSSFLETNTPVSDVVRVAGAGPSGQDVYRHALTYTSDDDGDDYWHWVRDFGAGAPFAYGSSVFLRWRQKFSDATDLRGLAQGGTGELSNWINKALIVNDGGGSNARYILELWGSMSPLRYLFKIQDDVNSTWVDPINQWVAVQVELRYSSALNMADAYERIWLNNNVQGSPSGERGPVILNAAGAQVGRVQFGAYYNNGVYSDGTISFDHADFEIGDSFDDAWAA